MKWGKFARGYVVLLLGTVALAFMLERLTGFEGERIVIAECALLFAVAASGRPRSLYLLVRNIGWFSAVDRDRAMRMLLVVLALGLALLAVLAPRGSLGPSPTMRRYQVLHRDLPANVSLQPTGDLRRLAALASYELARS
jgi:hypothetical protein